MTTEKIRTIIILLYSTDFFVFTVFTFKIDFGLTMKRIESRNNPIIKSVVALRNRREREALRIFYFEGVHLLEEFVRSGKKLKQLFIREDVAEKYSSLANSAGCEVFEVTSSVYEKITEEKAPQGLFAVSDYLDNVCSFDEKQAKAISGNSILLSDLQDTGNVGTVIRTAAALGCNVILCGNCADIYSPKTVRATMGAVFMSEVYIAENTEAAVGLLRNAGKRVIATALTDKAETLGKFEILPDDSFVIGNEGKGLTAEVISKCDFTAIIPMTGKTESLNAANASSIIMWETARGR